MAAASAKELEVALDATRAKYHALVDRWVDADGDAKALDVGTRRLAEECAWRQRGRPLAELAAALAACTAELDEGSLRSCTSAVAALRLFDEEVRSTLAMLFCRFNFTLSAPPSFFFTYEDV